MQIADIYVPFYGKKALKMESLSNSEDTKTNNETLAQ